MYILYLVDSLYVLVLLDCNKKHVAYEYAKKGAYLALVDRLEDRLEMVAETSRKLGSSNVIIIPGDVANVDDCKKFINETIHHFGKRKYYRKLKYMTNTYSTSYIYEYICVSYTYVT